MTPEQFIAKWHANTRTERAACQEHFIDLCNLLGEPTPNTDPTGANYAFEKGAVKATGGDGWADVWRRGCFAWEYKGKHRDLEAAHRQLLLYAGALANPPLLITSDSARIVIRTNWTDCIAERIEILLPELTDPAKRDILKSAFSAPDRLKPGKTRAALTAQAATAFAELASALRARGYAPQSVAQFVNRLVFCLFADDIGLLPKNLLAQMFKLAERRPTNFADYAGRLFKAMADPGGTIDFTPIEWFNGGLFQDGDALPLTKDDIVLLQTVAELDWADIDPAILGTLFERGLDPDKRSQLGAHYTDAAKIELIVDPVIRRPLLAEWAQTRTAIAAKMQTAATQRGKPAAKRAQQDATTLFRTFLDRLRHFRVLDPACGSGNFLYVSLLALKDLEHQAMVEAEALGLQREIPGVGPESMLGIELNPYAAELARVSVWIGDIQWSRRHGYPAPSDPILRKLDTIDCRDALLKDDGTVADWPKVDAIVGNPPFLGGKRMRTTLDDATCDRLFAAYAGSVPAEADLVCYWFARAHAQVRVGMAKAVGLVATNSIRGGANRAVLDAIVRDAAFSNVWSDEPWVLDGAAVRVSLVCFTPTPPAQTWLNGRTVPSIHADLSAGDADVTTARPLLENTCVAFMGDTKGGAFDIPGKLARQWLALPSNANGRMNAEVLRPWANGMDVTRRPSDTWIIDFGVDMSEEEAAYYAEPFAHVATHVRPIRAQNRRAAYAKFWWRHVEAREGMAASISPWPRFIATPTVAKHRLFSWVSSQTLPDHQLIVIARDDDTTFGILHSRFHELWSLRLGTWLGVGNDPRYTPTTTFNTFPFPEGLTPNIQAAAYESEPRAQAIATAARALTTARDRWLNPPELIKIVPEIVPGFPDRILPRDEKAAATLKLRTLTNLYNTRTTPAGAWLDTLHRQLDEAVAAAYGWPATLTDEEILSRLLAINQARPAKRP